MEEAMGDIALDFDLLPPGTAPQQGAQPERRSDQWDQAQLLATVSQSGQAFPALSHAEQPAGGSAEQGEEQADRHAQNRATRVEHLRQRIASGSYRVDSAELASRILRNSTRFTKTC